MNISKLAQIIIFLAVYINTEAREDTLLSKATVRVKREPPVFRPTKIIRTTRRKPKPIYGPPKPKYGPPKPIYGPPSFSYGAPISQGYSPPSSSYRPPSPTYSAPRPTYRAPSSTYGSPSPTYGAPFPPSQSYGVPSHNYGVPSQSYGTPNLIQSYGTPSSHYGSPNPTYGVPNQNYGPPIQSYASPPTYSKPTQTYGAPQNTYGAPSHSFNTPSFGGTSSHTYSSPSNTYGAPSTSYNQHTPQFGPVTATYSAPIPSQTYGSPSPSYGAPNVQMTSYSHPSPSYGTPSGGYDLPSTNYGTPPLNYDIPSASYGTPGAVTSYGTPVNSQPSDSYNAPLDTYSTTHKRSEFVENYDSPNSFVTDNYMAHSFSSASIANKTNIQLESKSTFKHNKQNIMTEAHFPSNYSLNDPYSKSVGYKQPNHNYEGSGIDDDYYTNFGPTFKKPLSKTKLEKQSNKYYQNYKPGKKAFKPSPEIKVDSNFYPKDDSTVGFDFRHSSETEKFYKKYFRASSIITNLNIINQLPYCAKDLNRRFQTLLKVLLEIIYCSYVRE